MKKRPKPALTIERLTILVATAQLGPRSLEAGDVAAYQQQCVATIKELAAAVRPLLAKQGRSGAEVD